MIKLNLSKEIEQIIKEMSHEEQENRPDINQIRQTVKNFVENSLKINVNNF
jgi:hypothetical protein